MGIFDKNYEKSSENLYENIKNYLKAKDEKKHVVLINTTSKLMTNGMECDNQYTIQINGVIEKMQQEGYDILDIKLDASQQVMGNVSLIRTLIEYK